MDTRWIQDEEYELQYYGFTATDFITELKDVILSGIKEAVTEVEENTLLNVPEEEKLEYSLQFDNLYVEYKRIALEHLNSVEQEIRGYIAIPPHVLLPNNNFSAPCPKSDIEILENEIKQLEDEYAKKRAFKFLCEKELETLSKFETFHNRVKNIATKITSNLKKKEEESNRSLIKVEEDLLEKLLINDDRFK